MSVLDIGPRDFSPRLIIFDKDGTLIDFHAMWAAWIADLAQRLEAASGLPLAARLFQAMDVDPVTRCIAAGGVLALEPMAHLRIIVAGVLLDAGLSRTEVEPVMAAWHAPDPGALAKPLTDLAHLLATLRARGARIAIATSDDHEPAVATMRVLGVHPLIDALIGADDGLPIKPAPDMVLHLCRALAVAPAQAVMVGDSVADMQMGRAAGVSLTIGVLSGVSPAERLAPYADLLVASVAELIDFE